jgi:hypothetical protein
VPPELTNNISNLNEPLAARTKTRSKWGLAIFLALAVGGPYLVWNMLKSLGGEIFSKRPVSRNPSLLNV